MVEYADNLSKNDLPVLFSIDHISALTGIKTNAIHSMMYSQDSFYNTFSIPKRNGGTRKISAPYPSLLEIQRWIANTVIKPLKVHDAAHGYVVGRSSITNATPHCGKTCLLKMDIKDFFPSISYERIFAFLKYLGYTKNISNILSRLMTIDGHTPQGAATSPSLSNVIFYNLDNRISKLSENCKITYTRYADDLTFSSDYISLDFIHYIENILTSGDFEVNTEKTKLIRQNGKKIVTGVSVSTESPKLPKSTKRLWRAEISSVITHGLIEHCNRYNATPFGLINRLEGKLSHWYSIEPDNSFVEKSWPKIKSLPTDINYAKL